MRFGESGQASLEKNTDSGQFTNDDNWKISQCDDLHLRARNAFFCPGSFLLKCLKSISRIDANLRAPGL